MRIVIATVLATLLAGPIGPAVAEQRVKMASRTRTYRPVTYKWLVQHSESAGPLVVLRDVRLTSCDEFTPGDWAWVAGIYEPSTGYGHDPYFAIVTDRTTGQTLKARLQGRENLRVTLYLKLADTGVGACLNDGNILRVDLLDEHGKRKESLLAQPNIRAPAPN
jgi:hypothetical protein